MFIAVCVVSCLCGMYYEKRKIKIVQRQIDDDYAIQEQMIQGEIDTLSDKRNALKSFVQDMEEQAQTAGDSFYKQAMEIAQNRLEKDKSIKESEFKNAIEQYKIEYLSTIGEFAKEFNKTIDEHAEEVSRLQNAICASQADLLDLHAKIDAAVESNKRALLDEAHKDFYKCTITDLACKEVKTLRSIEDMMRDSRPLCKIIWESYYRNSCSALLDRLTNGKKITGIYKITNLENNKVYIGQAVNIADRLKTHIKAGIGIDPTNSELYKDMKKIGVENFTFEILEECPQVDLNDKEKFWISFYHGQDFGYNITKGGSQRIVN